MIQLVNEAAAVGTCAAAAHVVSERGDVDVSMTGDPHSLTATLWRAAHSLIAADPARDLGQTVDGLVRTAAEIVPGADGGGLLRRDDGELSAARATDAAIAELEALQGRLRQGPGVTAVDDRPDDGIVLADDLGAAEGAKRWPEVASRAVALGYRSVLAVGLWSGHQRYAALSLYAREPGAFGPEARLVAAAFRPQAATLLYGAESAAGLDRALASRDVIGQAKGVLMERRALGADEAFRQLVRASQDTNMKLSAVARWVVDEAEQRAARRESEHGAGDPLALPERRG